MNELLDHPLISQRYFFPRRGALARPFTVDCGDVQLACSYHETDPHAKTLVHFHGNGEIVDDWTGAFVAAVVQAGCNCFLAEYRGYGGSTGVPQLGKMLGDVRTTIAALQRPAAELIFFGRSVGAIFALEAIKQFPAAAGLILESAIADVRERLLLRVDPAELGVSGAAFDAAVERQLNHREKLAGYRGPVLIMHTRNDGLVDVSHAERLYHWAAGKKTLKIFAHGHHNDIMFVNAAEYVRLLQDFIRSLQDGGLSPADD
jgi:pimeloyl-ACP methyl ester carboxylesterase